MKVKKVSQKGVAPVIPAKPQAKTAKHPMPESQDQPKPHNVHHPFRENLKPGLMHSLFTIIRPTLASSKDKPAAKDAAPQAQTKKPEKKEHGEVSMSLFRLYRRFSAAMPKRVSEHFDRKMRFAGVDPDQTPLVFGRALIVSFIAGALPLLLYLAIFNPIATPVTATIAGLLFFGGIAFALVLHYLNLYFKVADRTSEVEKLLPDFLSLAVSNLRAGMSPYEAFIHAARPEFGSFHDTVMYSMAKMGGKGSIAEALLDVSSNFDSAILRRTVTLFAKGVRSGGQLVRLLNSSAEEVRRIQDLRVELIASTRTYSIFLSFIVVMVMPFLLAVSTNFVMVFVRLQMETMGASTAMPGNSQISSFTGKILVTPDDMQNISLLTLVVINLMVSALIGVVDHGKIIYGVKNFPTLALLSIIAYIIAKAFIGSFLSSFML